MNNSRLFAGVLRTLAALLCLSVATPALAQDASALRTFRAQYDTMMANFEKALTAAGDTASAAKARRGREAMQATTDEQLAAVYSRTRIPDLSVVVTASKYVASSTKAKAAAVSSASLAGNIGVTSAGFPEPVDIPVGCQGVDIDAETRYALMIIKEVTNAILAAAAWVCNEDILGENGSLACVPLAIAADIANGFFDTATFCAGEVTANQVDANFNRLAHIHDDLGAAQTAIINTSNSNTASIITNDNTNTATIVSNDNTNTANIIINDNTNTTTIVNNDNANRTQIINNDNANKNELRDLILRTQIEQDLSAPDSSAVVAIFELPAASGGYLDLVTTIVTETIAKVQAAGGSVGTAQSLLNSANAAKAAGDFKGAYMLYRKAYKTAGK